ncbi:hypothetical protein Afil01_35360 [Actinorhabdospora filicis]|uniref:Type II restriction enzyme NaeI domain-containing protein n=1 Tax=Actinorhabdospora filicis TaxID=1785913 RepID=A0A9W6SMU3_9ACTN|nr:NaeI family type II restriction endonuclease [Actinorhabdospora filicis]GLZ78729.1 hypothetical protein Afil01_35360 [Actinorhabdospora filicis]
MQESLFPTPGRAPAGESGLDAGLDEVTWYFRGIDEELFGRVFRQSIDEVLDGPRTGRYRVDDLEKTEKTYLGTKVEIVLRAALGAKRGRKGMDYLIAGHDVDAKFSLKPWRWPIPGEAVGHLCLLLHADDDASHFRVGLVRVTEAILNAGANRDGKRTISMTGRTAVRWLIADGRLPANALLHMDPADRERILAARSGQGKITLLFEVVRGRLVSRDTVAVLAVQQDMPKRVRDARIPLRGKGIVVLGHQDEHPRIARELGLPEPRKGQWVSARLVPAGDDDRPRTTIGGAPYVVALPNEAEHPIDGIY